MYERGKGPGDRKGGVKIRGCGYRLFRRARRTPASPRPSSVSVAGSGTGVTAGAENVTDWAGAPNVVRLLNSANPCMFGTNVRSPGREVDDHVVVGSAKARKKKSISKDEPPTSSAGEKDRFNSKPSFDEPSKTFMLFTTVLLV